MAGSQEDLQVLLRVLTRKNGSMLTVVRQAKSLQSAGLRSIQQIAEAPLDVITQALGDAKSAKAAHNSCKKHITDESQRQKKLKRSGDADCPDPGAQIPPKRMRRSSDDSVSASQSIMTEGADEDLQMSVVLDLELVASTRVYTNRAPLLLAFAFVLIRFTMPEQPVSSRLSLSQAVVSLNARSKAFSLGLGGQPSGSHSSWTDGQPTVTIMGKHIPVLRRDGDALSKPSLPSFSGDKAVPTAPADRADGAIEPAVFSSWSKSENISSRGSTFVARIISISDAADGIRLVRALIDTDKELKTASHNSWGLRTRHPRLAVSSATGLVQKSEDDGETGCGAFILGLLKDAQLDNVLVVITRWFGGVLLGPQRWELMRRCFDGAISEHLRQTGQSGPDGAVPLWALDEDGIDRGHKRHSSSAESSTWRQLVPGAVVFRPETARDYLARSFLSAPPDTTTPREAAAKRRRVAASQGVSAAEHNMACVLGAIRAVFLSWEGHLSTKEMDARAWVWYATVRPQVEAGPSGWGEKGWLELKDILALRRQIVPVSEA